MKRFQLFRNGNRAGSARVSDDGQVFADVFVYDSPAGLEDFAAKFGRAIEYGVDGLMIRGSFWTWCEIPAGFSAERIVSVCFAINVYRARNGFSRKSRDRAYRLGFRVWKRIMRSPQIDKGRLWAAMLETSPWMFSDATDHTTIFENYPTAARIREIMG